MKRANRRGSPREPSLPPPQTPQSNPHHRDSDASSQPSFFFNPPPRHQQITDPAYKHAAVRAINAYLSSDDSSLPLLSLKPLPSANDVSAIIKSFLSKLGFSINPSQKLEDVLFLLLKYLNCPIKVNKSAFRSLGAPHSFPLLLALIHWLVQLVNFTDHLRSPDNSHRNWCKRDSIMAYSVESYVEYMKGNDVAVEDLDNEFTEKMENESTLLTENLKLKDEEAEALELELNALKSVPSEREAIEKQRKDLEVDLEKFRGFVASVQDANSVIVRALEEKGKELGAKVAEIRRTKEENEELKKRVELQGINMRDAERMKRQLVALDREITDAEASRSSWEKKSWDLDSAIGLKFTELESLFIDCNQALKRIKRGGDYQYVLNAKGSTPAEVLGIDYKSTLKPAINAFADEIKKSTTAKLEEFIALQQHFKEMTAKIEAKRNRLTVLHAHIDDRERQLETIRNEINEYASRCVKEAEKIAGDEEAEVHDLVIVESEALNSLKAAELKLQDETRKSEEETQLCAYELFALIDSVSRYKEDHGYEKGSVWNYRVYFHRLQDPIRSASCFLIQQSISRL
ncbi:hypothetical protein RND81_04G110700 [Saponaria officinalis]|uniref:Kinetochore protein NDC80 n=1 Tax=Saponaria officinalis TaxID=3572 RepID=A0AAW1LKU4_SAPOF